MIKAGLLFCLLTAVLAAAPRIDKPTGLFFPERVGRWAFSDFEEYESKDFGASYSYKTNASDLGAISCYIYSNGLPSIPLGGDSKVVAEEMAEVVDGIAKVWKKHGATVDELQPVKSMRRSKDGPIIGLFSVHRIVENETTSISISFLTGYKNQFVKLRYTFPGRDPATALRNVREFGERLLDENKDTIDPFFLPLNAPK